MELLTLFIGGIAAILTSFCFMPQVIKMWKTKSVNDISLLMLWQILIGVVLWFVYGILQNDLILVIANSVSFVINFFGIIIYYQFCYQNSHSSMEEQRSSKPKVGGSNPSGSVKL